MRHCGIFLAAVAAACFGTLLTGCKTQLSPEPFDVNLKLTAGNVKMIVQKGKTTQNDIFKALGTPNVIALNNGENEVWTYDQIKVRRTAQGYGAGAYFATLFMFSKANIAQGDLGNGLGDAGVQVSGSAETMTTSISTATLVIKFDANEKVSSYKMLVTAF